MGLGKVNIQQNALDANKQAELDGPADLNLYEDGIQGAAPNQGLQDPAG